MNIFKLAFCSLALPNVRTVDESAIRYTYEQVLKDIRDIADDLT